jgi:hypothetical protein
MRAFSDSALQSEQPYPKEELEWIVTNSFNHGIDLYCNEDDDGARRWLHKAINLATHMDDNGELQRLLQEKMLGLRFDN